MTRLVRYMRSGTALAAAVALVGCSAPEEAGLTSEAEDLVQFADDLEDRGQPLF